jgi:hypothetical protein
MGRHPQQLNPWPDRVGDGYGGREDGGLRGYHCYVSPGQGHDRIRILFSKGERDRMQQPESRSAVALVLSIVLVLVVQVAVWVLMIGAMGRVDKVGCFLLSFVQSVSGFRFPVSRLHVARRLSMESPHWHAFCLLPWANPSVTQCNSPCCIRQPLSKHTLSDIFYSPLATHSPWSV